MAKTVKKSADKKPNTQAIRRKKYNPILNGLQEGMHPHTVLKHLIRKGKTSSLEIMTLFYIVNPTACISYLRQKGCTITSRQIVENGENGKVKRYYIFELV